MVKKIMRKILIIGGLIVNLGISHADVIEVSGDVFGTWTTGNTYVVAGTTTVDNGLKLVIEPGVIVKFTTDTSLIAYGKLEAVGNSSNKIVFASFKDETNGQGTSTIANAGDWSNIKLSGNGANGSKIGYCIIKYGRQGNQIGVRP